MKETWCFPCSESDGVIVEPVFTEKCAYLIQSNCESCVYTANVANTTTLNAGQSIELTAVCGNATAVMTIDVVSGALNFFNPTATGFALSTLSGAQTELNYSTLFTTSLPNDGDCTPRVSGSVSYLSLNETIFTPSQNSQVNVTSEGSLGPVNGQYEDDPNTQPNQNIFQNLNPVLSFYAIQANSVSLVGEGFAIELQPCSHAAAILTCDENDNPVSATSGGVAVPVNSVQVA